MIILDENKFINQELKDKGFEIFDFYEHHKIVDMKTFVTLDLKRRNEFLLVDTQTLLNHPNQHEIFKSLMNTFLGAVFFHEHSNQKAQDWVKDNGMFLTKIIGEYSLPMPQLQWTILSNQFQFFWNLLEDQKKLQKNMVQFSQELDLVLQDAEDEMKRAKKVHETLIPNRSEEIKGVYFANKYAAGEGGGSEFYDLHQGSSKVFQVLISSQSYLISSAILGIIGQYRNQEFNPQKFLDETNREIETINGAKKKKSEVDITILELDLNTLILKSHTESKVELYSQIGEKIKLNQATSYQIEKGEKLIVFSTGFLFNWSVGHPDQDLGRFIKDQKVSSINELMTELFFQLKESKDGQFLKKDATVVMMEVNRHGIYKV